MVKEIKIGDKAYKLSNSMWSHKIYVEQFGTDMFTDISNVQKLAKDMKDINVEITGKFIDVALKVAYAMILDAETEISWKDFNKSIDNISENQGWILEVIQFATTFRGKN